MSSPWEKSVDVVLESLNPLKFDVQPTGAHPLPTQNGLLVFNNDHHDGFNIEFNLVDKTKGGYLWPPNKLKDQAVWSKLGSSGCAASPDTEVFHAISVDQTCTKLKVNNPNQKPAIGQFQYTLCVTNDGGNTYLALDPGGINNNGPISFNYSLATAVIIAVIGGAIGAAVGWKGEEAANITHIGAYALAGAVIGLAIYFVARAFGSRS